MSNFKPLSIDERIKRQALIPRPLHHHSITDWDFQSASWTLDGVVYHDAAPSLHGTASNQALIKHATTGALSDGRLVLWLRSSNASFLAFLSFRNQDADTNASRTNLYQITIQGTSLKLSYFIGGDVTDKETKDMAWTWDLNTWYKIRLTWWTSAERLYARVERWTGTAWVTLGGDADVDFEDTSDRWKNETINRVGLHLSAAQWLDDVEVWG